MKINLKKDKFKDIENAFAVLKEDPQNKAAINMIKESLESCFSCKFSITVVPVEDDKPLFVMSVFPEMSTMDKIIASIMSDDKKKDDTIKKLWEKNKSWNLEIDERILTDGRIDASQRELTALLLHEIGHIVCSNSLPNRFITILQYEVAKTNMKNKMLLKDKIFRKVLCIPILNACIADDKNKKGLKTEIKADNYSKKMGYSNELNTILKKLIKMNEDAGKDENLKELTQFSIDTVNQLKERQANIVKQNMDKLATECVSPYMKEFLEDFRNTIFQEDDRTREAILERAVEISSDEAILEGFLFRPKQLQRIDPAELDYIEVKIPEIKSDSDKMMLISYLHSKLDMVNYYISIAEHPKLSRKYSIPHSLRQLLDIKKRLENDREIILKYKIPEKTKGMLVAWPEDYEG